jgi:WD40 repeat protein
LWNVPRIAQFDEGLYVSPYQRVAKTLSLDGVRSACHEDACREARDEIWSWGDWQNKRVVFSPDGKLVATDVRSILGIHAVVLWDAYTGEALFPPLTLSADVVRKEGDIPPRIAQFGFNASGSRLLLRDKHELMSSWDTRTGSLISSGEPRLGPIFHYVTPIEAVIKGEGVDGVIELHDRNSGSILGSLTAPSDIRIAKTIISMNGQLLAATGYNEPIRIWDLATLLEREPLLRDKSEEFHDIAFANSSGSIVVSGGQDVVIWDTVRGLPIGPGLNAHQGDDSDSGSLMLGEAFILSASLSSQRVASVGRFSGEVIIWDVSVDSWLRRACKIAGRTLTPQEQTRYVSDERFGAPACQDEAKASRAAEVD